MASDSDSDIFLTQNSFRNEMNDSDGNDEINYDDVFPNENVEKETEKFYLAVSDISDDELIAASLAMEEKEKIATVPSGPSRFDKPVNDEEMANISRQRLSDSTERKIRWAVNLFNQWQKERNIQATSNPSLNISSINVHLDNMTKDELNYSISRFLCEVKKHNGEHYPGNTLHEMVICFQLHFELKGIAYKFLNDPSFLELKNTLDRKMQERAQSGIGAHTKQAQVITVDEEDMLWKSEILGSSNPTQLLNTLVYMVGLNFALRGGQEHRSLRWKEPQLELLTDSTGNNFLRYSEDCSKTNQGGLKHRKIKPKVVDAYENKKDRKRCLVTLFKKYTYHCPENKPNGFYLRPLAKPKGAIWYAATPIGRHKLSQVVSELCKKGGLSGHRTNHSLRATAASRLYDEQIDEQLICEVTGHRSNAVRNYKRTTDTLKRKVNAVVQGLTVANPSTSGSSNVSNEPDEDNNQARHQSVSSVIENTGLPGATKHISLTLNFNL